jgi:hypothetical protein
MAHPNSKPKKPKKRDPSELTVVTAYFNPILYESRRTLYAAFLAHMREAGVRLVTVECALGDRPFEVTSATNRDHVQVRSRTLVWNKENLLNLGIAHVKRTDPGCKYVGWFDGDIRFRNPNWAERTIQALQHYAVIQPWAHCYDLGPDGEHVQVDMSLAWCWHHHMRHRHPHHPYRFCHPGYAWAARMDELDKVGGLLECAALGAADHHMGLAIVGKVRDSAPKGLAASYYTALDKWERLALKWFDKNFGYVSQTIEHGWHGLKKDRQYVDRWQILVQEKFCPVNDLSRNAYGVVELAGNKRTLRHRVDQYFRQRNEDRNTL